MNHLVNLINVTVWLRIAWFWILLLLFNFSSLCVLFFIFFIFHSLYFYVISKNRIKPEENEINIHIFCCICTQIIINWVRYQCNVYIYDTYMVCCVCNTQSDYDRIQKKKENEKNKLNGFSFLSLSLWFNLFITLSVLISTVCMCDVMFGWQTISVNWSLTELFNFHRA